MNINIKDLTEEQRVDLIKQLQKHSPAQKWSEGGAINGYFIDNQSEIDFVSIKLRARGSVDRNIFKTKAQAESSLAYAQLTQLMAEVTGDWKTNSPSWIWNISVRNGCLFGGIHPKKWNDGFLDFPTAEIRDKFLADHQELLKTYFQIN